MNLKEYIESDIIDFEIKDDNFLEYKKLFNKAHGLRNYITPYAAYIINYSEKTSTMINVFEENFQELKAFKIICEKYNFKFNVSLLEFEGISQEQNVIQTLKFMITTEKILKKKNFGNYKKLINSDSVINEAKRRFSKFLTLKENDKFSIAKC